MCTGYGGKWVREIDYKVVFVCNVRERICLQIKTTWYITVVLGARDWEWKGQVRGGFMGM